MPKRKFDSALTSDIKTVSCDSFRDHIRMLPIDSLKESEANFYSLSELTLLAEDIERQGLKHNLVVNEDMEHPGTYFIISGHRRFAAIKLLTEEGRYGSQVIPCYITGQKTEAETMLDLIMLNATTRRMTDAEFIQQYEFLEETLHELEAAGTPVSGRMRDRIATVLNVSAAQVGKIENILHNGIDEIQQAVKDGEMSISTASAVSSLSTETQKQLVEEKHVSEIRNKDAQSRKKKQAAEPPQPDLSDEPDDENDEIDGQITFVPTEETEDTEDVPQVAATTESISFKIALSELTDIAGHLRSKLFSALTIQDLNRVINETIHDLENMKGKINYAETDT